MLTQLNACWNPIDDNHVFFKSYIPNAPHGSMWIMNIILLNIIITPYWATCVNCKANSKSSTIGYTWPNFSRSVVEIWSHFQFHVFAVMCKHLQISKTYSGFMIPPPQFWHTIQIISTLKRPDFHNFSVFFFGLNQWRTWNMNLTLPEIGLKM